MVPISQILDISHTSGPTFIFQDWNRRYGTIEFCALEVSVSDTLLFTSIISQAGLCVILPETLVWSGVLCCTAVDHPTSIRKYLHQLPQG